MQLHVQLDIRTPLNWLDFHCKALLSSYSMLCSPWWPFSVIKCLVKIKLPTTNYLSAHLYHKIDSDPSEISRTSTSKIKLSSLGLGTQLASLMMTHTQIMHGITKSSVYIVYSYCSALVHRSAVRLDCHIATVTSMHVNSCMLYHSVYKASVITIEMSAC